jgi:formamidopyrimidine-DNA glycosylase
MPELPEVETTKRGIAPYIEGQQVTQIIVRQAKLRWPIPDSIQQMCQQTVQQVQRRAKYLILKTPIGSALIHLGMSGSLRIVEQDTVAEKHDHIDLCFDNGNVLRLRDPRRFGSVLWTQAPLAEHRLLKKLAPEPLSDAFHADYLYRQAINRRVTIKVFIMNAHHVVGVGNIYASEALFIAGIHPTRAAGEVSYTETTRLVECIKQVLRAAIEQGGTTLKDFANPQGESGYFQVKLQVYGKKDQTCSQCSSTIQSIKLGQRASFYCPTCQS